MSSIIEALAMARRGYYIFPCSTSKHPLCEHGLTESTINEATIIAWWTRWPDAQIGINCGLSKIFVLDVDSAETWETIKVQHPEFLTTRRIKTGKGGYHLYFHSPEGIKIKSTAKKIQELPNVDTRCAGGYVIAEGCRNENGPYVVDNNAEIERIPGSLMILLVKNEIVDMGKPVIDAPKIEPKTNGIRTPGPEYWVDKYSREASVGSRNKIAAYLAAQLKAEGLSENEAKYYMLQYQRSVDRSDKPYTEKEAINSLEFVYSNYNAKDPIVLTNISDRAPYFVHVKEEANAETHPTVKPLIWFEPTLPPKRDGKEPNLLVFKLTDYGNAERLEAMYGAYIRYCHETENWYIWNGIRWRPDYRETIYGLALDTLRASTSQASRSEDEGREKTIRYLLHSENKSGLAAMISLAATRPQLQITNKEMDNHKDYLNAKNGTINLRTGKLQPHNYEDYLTRLVEIDYDDNAAIPAEFQEFMDMTFSKDTDDHKKDIISFLQRAKGYSLTGETGNYLFILYGCGKNNKSTLYLLFQKLLGMGEYSQQTQPDTFLAKKYRDDKRDDLAALNKIRYLTCSEGPEGARLDEGIVKQVTGGDPVSCRFLHKNRFTYYPEFKPWYISNHKPRITGTDTGIRSRIMYIEFKVYIPGKLEELNKPRIDHYEDHLIMNYGPGILKWAVDGAVQYYNGGLNAPKCVKESTDAYLAEQDIVQRWINDNCDITDKLAVTRFSDLYENYQAWCEGEGESVYSSKTFATKLSDKCYEKVQGSGAAKWRKGIKLLSTDTNNNNKNDDYLLPNNENNDESLTIKKPNNQQFIQSVTLNDAPTDAENVKKVTDVTDSTYNLSPYEANKKSTNSQVTSVTQGRINDSSMPNKESYRLIDELPIDNSVALASDKRHYDAIIMEIQELNKLYNKSPVLSVVNNVHEKGFGREATEKEIRRLLGIGEITLDDNGNLQYKEE